MADVADWLLSQGVNTVWVGGRDLLQDDMIKWIRGNKLIDGTFWMPGEPQFYNGDCVILVTDVKLLATCTCDTMQSYLCRLYPS